jgi:hypothetical protein
MIKNLTSKQYFRQLNILHGALLSGLLIFLSLTMYLIGAGGFTDPNMSVDIIFIWLVPISLLLGVFVSPVIAFRRIRKIDPMDELSGKLATYQSIVVVRAVLLEGPGLFAIIAIMITNNQMYMAYVVIVVIMLHMARPTKSRTIRELNLSDKEQEKIYDPSAIVAKTG